MTYNGSYTGPYAMLERIAELEAENAKWKQKYSLLESQIANCHKEMKKLREAMLATVTNGDHRG